MTSPSKPRKTTGEMARLRRDIDRGRTGDKVAWPDPAAAPLGTDDEAAGTQTRDAVIKATRRHERRSGKALRQHKRAGIDPAWWMVGFAAVVAAALILASQLG